MKNLDKALAEVDITYDQIKQIADDITLPLTQPINDIINFIERDINNLSIDALRNYMLNLQIEAFKLSEIRDKAATKAECAEAIRKEAYATNFLGQDGTATVKESNATLAISENIIVEYLYELSATLIKTKVDHTLRMIDTLKTIMMSRMQETKISAMNLAE